MDLPALGDKSTKAPGAGEPTSPPRWREDFPIRWENDQYILRREMAKYLTLGSGLLAGAGGVLAVVARLFLSRAASAPPRARIARSFELPPGGSLLFRYPTDADPCIAVRSMAGELVAYSQVCTHLSCAIVHTAGSQRLRCPCHEGYFAVKDGRPVAGPPIRRLPRILLEERGGELYAVGREG